MWNDYIKTTFDLQLFAEGDGGEVSSAVVDTAAATEAEGDSSSSIAGQPDVSTEPLTFANASERVLQIMERIEAENGESIEVDEPEDVNAVDDGGDIPEYVPGNDAESEATTAARVNDLLLQASENAAFLQNQNKDLMDQIRYLRFQLSNGGGQQPPPQQQKQTQQGASQNEGTAPFFDAGNMTEEQVQEALDKMYSNPYQFISEVMAPLLDAKMLEMKKEVDPKLRQVDSFIANAEKQRQVGAIDEGFAKFEGGHADFKDLENGMTEFLNDNPELARSLPQEKFLDLAYNYAKGRAALTEEEFLSSDTAKEYMRNNPGLQTDVAKSMIGKVKANQPPNLMGNIGGTGNQIAAPEDKPRTWEDALSRTRKLLGVD